MVGRYGDKEVNKLLSKIEKQDGWSIKYTKKGHYKVTNPEGESRYLSSTPGGPPKTRSRIAKKKLRDLGADI